MSGCPRCRRLHLRFILCALTFGCALFGLAALTSWDQQAFAQPPSPEQKEKLRERDRLWAETQKLRAGGKLAEAIQTAGARSVVAGLWQVDDDATRKLMVRFYESLWRSKEPLGKLAALREAQLWMLREGVKRGLVRLTEKEASHRPKRTPPYYWAAFALSGDWR